MTFLLDTSVLLGPPLTLAGPVAISAITLAELHFGVLVASDPAERAERLRRLAVVEREFQPLPVDDRVARSFGLLASLVAATGRSPRPRAMDLLVAATAHAHGARLVTRNPGDLLGLGEVVEVVVP